MSKPLFSKVWGRVPMERRWSFWNVGPTAAQSWVSLAAPRHDGRLSRLIASGSPWKTTFWLSVHRTLPPMEKIEHEEGV